MEKAKMKMKRTWYGYGVALLTVVLFSLVLPAPASACGDEGSCKTCGCLYISGGDCCPPCFTARDGEMGTTGCSSSACSTGPVGDCETWGTFCSEILVIP